MENIRLNIDSGASSIVYIRDTFDDLFPLLEKEKDVTVIIDKNVDLYYGKIFEGYKKIIIETSESNKTLKVVDHIIGELLEMEVGRDALLLGVGGGITTDVTGFVASIYKRGVKCAYISTSLLGQIDASFGGKTGVNYAGYKNIIGVIKQPLFSYINTSVLKTLPEREFRSGLAEMLKTFIIADRSAYQICVDLFSEKDGYEKLMENIPANEAFNKLITTAVRTKSWIVERDEKEKGERRLLNLGHTFGHAIEKCSSKKDNILHGEAVAEGLVISVAISNKLEILSNEDYRKIISDFDTIGLPTKTNIPAESLLNAILNDKKREGDVLHFVLIQNIGSAIIKNITIDEIKGLYNDLC